MSNRRFLSNSAALLTLNCGAVVALFFAMDIASPTAAQAQALNGVGTGGVPALRVENQSGALIQGIGSGSRETLVVTQDGSGYFNGNLFGGDANFRGNVSIGGSLSAAGGMTGSVRYGAAIFGGGGTPVREFSAGVSRSAEVSNPDDGRYHLRFNQDVRGSWVVVTPWRDDETKVFATVSPGHFCDGSSVGAESVVCVKIFEPDQTCVVALVNVSCAKYKSSAFMIMIY